MNFLQQQQQTQFPLVLLARNQQNVIDSRLSAQDESSQFLSLNSELLNINNNKYRYQQPNSHSNQSQYPQMQQQQQMQQQKSQKNRKSIIVPYSYVKRNHIVQACDQCRDARRRCEKLESTSCKRCISESKTCTFERIPRKRGRTHEKKQKKMVKNHFSQKFICYQFCCLIFLTNRIMKLSPIIIIIIIIIIIKIIIITMLMSIY
jgi:hypothetical protein